MGKWEVTEQAVAAMNNMSAQLQELSIKINQETHLNNRTNVVSTQAEHKTYISDRAGKINAIQEDLKNGSGRNISVMDATKMLESVEEFTGTRSTPIRTAYNNPNAEQHDAEALKALDDYINSAPKWKGTLYRGISVTSEQAEKIISGEDIDMLDPASWLLKSM